VKTVSIRLTAERETLLVPLLSKAVEVAKGHAILHDPKAADILGRLDYDFARLHVPKQSLLTLAIRAKKLDSCVEGYIRNNRNPLIIHLGCGLDSRVLRVSHDRGQWYDLDYPDVIELRRMFFEGIERYRMIGSSVTDDDWVGQIKESGPACIIAEGLMMYLREEDARKLVGRVHARFPGSEMAFDVYSEVTARRVKNHPSIRKTGAEVHWGIDDSAAIETWGAGIRLLEEWCFTQSEDIKQLGLGNRMLFGLAGLFPAARKAHRILRIRL
jgi:O-methyltransferase involved in polyketide biosynthesis